MGWKNSVGLEIRDHQPPFASRHQAAPEWEHSRDRMGGQERERGESRGEASIFHDEQLDGPLPLRPRTFVLTTDAERQVVISRVAGLDGVDVITAEDVPEASDTPSAAVTPTTGRPERQLAMLAVRLEMTATYLRLVRG